MAGQLDDRKCNLRLVTPGETESEPGAEMVGAKLSASEEEAQQGKRKEQYRNEGVVEEWRKALRKRFTVRERGKEQNGATAVHELHIQLTDGGQIN